MSSERGDDGVWFRVELRAEVGVHDDLADDVDRVPGAEGVEADEFVRLGLFAKDVEEHQGRVDDERDQSYEVARRETGIEDGAQHLPLTTFEANHVVTSQELGEVVCGEVGFAE